MGMVHYRDFLTEKQRQELEMLWNDIYYENHDNTPGPSGLTADQVNDHLEQLINILLMKEDDGT